MTKPRTTTELGSELRTLRLMAGLSQEAAARLVGLTQDVVSDYETGKNVPRTERVARYRLALTVAVLEQERKAQ
jgi:transcriptional regulator with XRE-family HTH domain